MFLSSSSPASPASSPPDSPTWGDALAAGVTFHPPASWVALRAEARAHLAHHRVRSPAPIRGEVTLETLLLAEELAESLLRRRG